MNNQTKQKSIPEHIVLFPDGNRRWAREHGTSIPEGYLKGKEKFAQFFRWCKDRHVKVVTVFGFSTENWNRPKEEVDFLMELFEYYLSDQKELESFRREGAKVRVIGQREMLSPTLQQVILYLEDYTKEGKEIELNLAVSYGGRWDIVHAVRQIVRAGLKPEEITEETFASYLSTAGQPYPDLIIRVGGEHRLSNFVLWQAAYAELYFCPKYWPAFEEQDFQEAIDEFARRQRRFGK
ncbi:MAG: di-trans,poly-cis-decaprenylcistransferase [Candidatus Wildermuthbacteria bacterium RIFCSPHIGHO2_12_FULL_45_9]|uniref:Isoprenyl transferase n=1 Tax=Candidatus Wildermuthbacteria bacterium RIFCSPHIGHO2_02_FULL_45_25 TaxID=1802450 RepID=A0A1G2R0Q1_9BACT|nr:MAG: di-trans,poly-cis-decaprenylcistransferase [Candidatus Wildermuthbacteria bacterium RIFCSPHIGHO2_01_FULL_45_20]OHA66455.1 MAG: di-trans,poly-cis-decaprenylcistransferase [Candidatus Wildermuthbacteria bacterium RIFCSPHIGHO2_02_FULL_45_25]OHA71489.1 MAG: di-trans,poly-cis-decaprenylcistransferase [Candidatus Wildermuthbacteria bacterium RIFCSPHIGHO2_12_FULL_45_9]